MAEVILDGDRLQSDLLALADARPPYAGLLRALSKRLARYQVEPEQHRLADTEVPDPRTRAHRNAPETSLDAATLPPERLRRQQARVLRILSDSDGLTNEEMEVVAARMWQMSPQSLRPRTLELRRYGYVEDSELRRPTRSGKNAVVWRITPAGTSAASNLTDAELA